jgi:hypothetical protein
MAGRFLVQDCYPSASPLDPNSAFDNGGRRKWLSFIISATNRLVGQYYGGRVRHVAVEVRNFVLFQGSPRHRSYVIGLRYDSTLENHEGVSGHELGKIRYVSRAGRLPYFFLKLNNFGYLDIGTIAVSTLFRLSKPAFHGAPHFKRSHRVARSGNHDGIIRFAELANS